MARWQPRQAFAQAVTSVERPFHTYLEEMRRRESLVGIPAEDGKIANLFYSVVAYSAASKRGQLSLLSLESFYEKRSTEIENLLGKVSKTKQNFYIEMAETDCWDRRCTRQIIGLNKSKGKNNYSC